MAGDQGRRTEGLTEERHARRRAIITTRRFVAILVAAVVIGACADSRTDEPTAEATTIAPEVTTVVGVVIAVDGNLEGVDSFTMRLTDGSDVTFEPDEDAQFDHGPISHLREHLASGEPVRVDYVVLADGTYRAIRAGDA